MKESNGQGYVAVYVVVAAIWTVTLIVWVAVLMQAGVL